MTKEYILTVNQNRFKEGARVLEDIARFVFYDFDLFVAIKKLKQQVKITTLAPIQKQDIGGPGFEENNQRLNLRELIHANCSRMQEAARVLEEFGDSGFYKKIRFQCYDIHQRMFEKLLSWTSASRMRGIYPICDPQRLSLTDMAAIIKKENIAICQLRMKNCSIRELYQAAKTFRSLLGEETLLIINDHFDIALLTADGVHIGQNDLPIEEVRAQSPQQFIIGVSCHNLQEALFAETAGSSYISLGCVFPTTTKHDITPISIKDVSYIADQISIPVCVIGGINFENMKQLSHAKIDMYAMCGGFWHEM